MPVQIRVDDFLYTKRDEHLSGQHTRENFLRFHDCIPVKYLLGVIPMNCVGFEMQYSDLNVEPALHGVEHPEDRLDEFERTWTPDIIDRIEMGVDQMLFLGFDRPLVYMPPHNVFNVRTCIALKKVGTFQAVTGGPETDQMSIAHCRTYGLRYIPSMPPLEYGRSDELMARGGVEHLRRLHDEGGSCVLGLHWTWEHNIGLDSLRRFVDQIRDTLEDFRV